MELFFKDLGRAARTLAKSPSFTAIALVTLALAIGANTAIFSVVNSLLVKPLPFPDSDRLMQVLLASPGDTAAGASIPRFIFWRDHARVFERLAAFDNLGSGFNVAGSGPPERIIGSQVSGDFFPVFGVKPALGRGFLADEDRPGGPRVVVLSHGLWMRRFGGDPAVLGQELHLNGESYTVVGVTPAWFRYPVRAELWMPARLDPTSRDKANYLEVVGRLHRGTSLARARSELAVVDRRFVATSPDLVTNPDEAARVVSLQDRLYGRLKPPLAVLLGAVACVLLIACINLANLELARNAARQRETAIRAVLGARTGRIVRERLTESLLLATAGGALGLLFGQVSLAPLLSLSPVGLTLLRPIGLDANVLVFTFGIAVLSGLLFGLGPAWSIARSDPHKTLNETSGRVTTSRHGAQARRLLVIVEVALAVVLLTCASLLVRSFAGLVGTDPGFVADRVLTLKMSLSPARYSQPEALDRWSRQVIERVASLPAVEETAIASFIPMESPGPDLPFTIDGRYHGSGSNEGVGEAQYLPVTDRFLNVLRIPLLRGRSLTATDGLGAARVAVINETAARRYWPGGDAVGARITIGQPIAPELADPGPRTIVGVVKDVREKGLQEEAPAIIYLPVAQVPPSLLAKLVTLLPVTLVVRGRTETGLAAAVEREIQAIDPEQPVTDVRSLQEIVNGSLGLQRWSALLVGLLAFVALLLSMIGIYGVLSLLVEQRSREIGVRMALGATTPAVLRLVVGQGMAAVLVGVGIGLACAFALTRVLAGLLVGVSARDPAAFVGAAVILTVVALFATGLPAQ
jgi:predicted permease